MNKINQSNHFKNIEEIRIGDSEEFSIIVTQEMHNTFSNVCQDFSPIHTDIEFSSKTQFKKPIGYAFLLAGLLSRMYGEYLPGGSSVCLKQECKFPKPYYVGDNIHVKSTVIDISEGTRIIEIKTEMFKNDDLKIFEGIGLVQVLFNRDMVNCKR